MMRQFYTPPITDPKFDSSISIRESYGADRHQTMYPAIRQRTKKRLFQEVLILRGH